MDRVVFIIGSAKAGTSALAHWLGGLPGIRVGVRKEPRFFTDFARQEWSGPGSDRFRRSLVRDLDAYRAFYPGLAPGEWALDASTDYLWSAGTGERIAEYAREGEVKLIAVVRDPIERAVSEYNHTLRAGLETLSFADAADREDRRRADGWIPLFYHRRRSEIASDLARFRALFGNDLLVLDYHDLQPGGEARSRICAFLGLAPDGGAGLDRRNASRLPRGALARQLLESRRLRMAARAMVPRVLRQRAYAALHADARSLPTVGEGEINAFRERIADEVQTCLAEPGIPTDNWTLARAGSPAR